MIELHMMFTKTGKGLGAKYRSSWHSLSKHKKDKKNFLHIALTYFQGNKTCRHTYTVCCVLHNQPCSSTELRKTETNMYIQIHQQNTCLCLTNFYCHGALNRTYLLCRLRYINHLPDMCILTTCINKIYYLHVS